MGRGGKKHPKGETQETKSRNTKKSRLKPYKKKHINHRSTQFWKDYNDDYEVFSSLGEEEE